MVYPSYALGKLLENSEKTEAHLLVSYEAINNIALDADKRKSGDTKTKIFHLVFGQNQRFQFKIFPFIQSISRIKVAQRLLTGISKRFCFCFVSSDDILFNVKTNH